MSPGIVVTPTTPFNNAEGTAGFETILKHTTLFVVAAAEQHRNVLQYGSNIRHYKQTPNIGQPYVGVDTPTSSLTHLVAARVFMCTVRPFVIFSESLVLVTQTLDNYLACFASCICLKPSCISLARSNLASINLANCSAVNTCSLSGCNFSSLFSFIYP